MRKNWRFGGFFTALIISLVALGVVSVRAEDLRAADIVRALSPTLTRGLASSHPSPQAAEDEAFVNSLRDRGTRSLSIGEMSKLDRIVDTRKKIDATMEFAYNSSVLKGKDLDVVNQLGTALSDPALKDQTFLLMGHTDAKGSEPSNLRLSERRAYWVKEFLVKNYKIPAERLVTVGYGESHLKNAEDPYAAENRRVQVVNVMAHKAANN